MLISKQEFKQRRATASDEIRAQFQRVPPTSISSREKEAVARRSLIQPDCFGSDIGVVLHGLFNKWQLVPRSVRVYDSQYGMVSVVPRGRSVYLEKTVNLKLCRAYISTVDMITTCRLESARKVLHHKLLRCTS